MDLFDYASELFNLNRELYVPGLGYFAQSRKESYYSNGSLYPPVNQTKFDPTVGDDNDELANYFATKKKISPASAQYFVDKLVEQLKSTALTGEAAFADIGIFYTANGALCFKAKQANDENDPALFGYAPVKFLKPAAHNDASISPAPRLETEQAATGDASYTGSKSAVNTNTGGANTEAPLILLSTSAGRDQQGGISAWLWTAFAVILMAIIGAGLYYYATHTMDNDKVNAQNNPVNQSYDAEKAKVKIAPASAADLDTATANKALSADSAVALEKKKALAEQAPAVNTAPLPAAELFKNSWVVSGGQNNDYAGAVRLLARYRGQGYPQARMLDSVKKKEWFIYRVIFGFYDTKQQAGAARRQLLKQGKLRPKYITVQPTNKQQ